jgi:HSP20 family protein
MRMGNQGHRTEFDDIVSRWFGSDQGWGQWPAGGFNVPTDVFHTDDRLVIRMELPGVNPDDVDVTIQENVLLINGTRKFPFDADKVRFVRRGTFYGDFTQKVALGKGLNTEGIGANYENGVLEVTIPYAEEVQPKKISIELGSNKALSS